MSARRPRTAPRRLILPTLAAIAMWACSAHAAPTLGFIEDFPASAGAGSWGGGSVVPTNPGTGGFGGSGDGYLYVTNLPFGVPEQLGTRSGGAEYAGDWVAAGITQVRVWLNDVNGPDPLELHLSLGNSAGVPAPASFWQYNVGFIPPSNRWGEYVVDLTSGAWTETIGTGTFADALHHVDKLHIRHDLAPFGQIPDHVLGDFGLDHVVLTNATALGVAPRPQAVLQPVQLAAPSPNPSRGSVALALESSDASPVHLQVVDAMGRSVRRAELPAGVSGVRIWTWDGADDQGRRVAPGCYRVRAWSAAGGTSRALVRVN